MQQKCIIFDLDDTLLDKEHELTDYTLEVLKKAQSLGHLIVINTARSQQFTQELFDRIKPDYCITNGGALIVDSNMNIISERVIPAAQIREITHVLLEVTEVFSVQTSRGFFTNNEDYKNQNAVYFNYREDFFPYDGYKIVASVPDADVAVGIAERFGLEYTSYFSGDFKRYNHIEATKALGNRRLIEHLGISLDDVIAFGDDWGDLAMLQEAGVGVLMKNAREELHEHANYISEHTNDEDGVAKFLMKQLQL